jgi:hypothetical protein
VLQPPPHGGATAEHPFQQVGTVGEIRPHNALERRKRGQRPRVLQIPASRRLGGQFADVRRQARAERRSPSHRQSCPDQQHTGRRGGPLCFGDVLAITRLSR